MSAQQAERAQALLYEDISLRDALTDDEAQALLKWSVGQLDNLAAQNLPDAAFDAAYASLCEKVRAINRYVGERQNLTVKQQQVLYSAINPAARVSPPLVANFTAQAAPSTDNLALIQQLTAGIAAPLLTSKSDEPIDL
jgi:hypothetical protein